MASYSGQDLPRPLIGVTGNAKRLSPSWYCIRLAIWLAGGKALRITIKSEIDDDALAGLVISGGDDIHPTLYGELPDESVYYDRQRDTLESDYIQYALRNNIPLLGICRGHQLINVVMGGSLFLSIREMRNKTSNRPGLLPNKKVTLVSDSTLQSIINGGTIRVNSLHSQAVDRVAEGLREAARDRDNIIQAVEAVDDRAILGVQWHPEYLWFLPKHLALFKWLVSRCNQRQTRQMRK